MNSTARREAILPHEMKEIELIFNDILRDRGLTRRCEAAEWIAKRLLSLYQSGIRDNGSLKDLVGASD